MKEAGNLEGILLTGLTKDGVDLMESYVDRTGDVQTASFCMLKVHRNRETMTNKLVLFCNQDTFKSRPSTKVCSYVRFHFCSLVYFSKSSVEYSSCTRLM